MKRFINLCAIAVMLIASAFAFTGCSEGEYDEYNYNDPAKETLKIGLECAYAPFNWSQPNRTQYTLPISGTSLHADGYDIQIAKMISKELNMNVEIKMVEWDSLTTMLNSNQIDLIIAGMSPTAERKEVIDFTEGYYRTTHVVLMKKNSQYVDAKGLNDFAGAKALGQANTLYDTLIDQLVGSTHQPAVDTTGVITQAIKSGTADISVLEKPVAEAIVAVNSELTYVTLEEPFDVLEEDVIVSIGIRQNNEDLKTKLNACLAKISQQDRDEIMNAANLRQSEL